MSVNSGIKMGEGVSGKPAAPRMSGTGVPASKAKITTTPKNEAAPYIADCSGKRK